MKKRIAQLFLTLAMAVATPPVLANPFLEIREAHWLEAMEIGRVDSEILYAIALQESGTSFNGMREYGPWPWTMNIDEKGLFFSSRAAARKALATEIEAGNDRIAVGMWQIYLKHNGKYVENPLDLIDPVTNLYAAAMVLRSCGDHYSTTRHVLACYYSGDPDEKGLKYAESVLSKARKWGRPFVMANATVPVRYGHLDEVPNPTPDSIETEVRESLLIVYEDVPTEAPSIGTKSNDQQIPSPEQFLAEQKPAISLELLASIKKPFVPQSHLDFLAKMDERETNWTQRVVVVE